MPRTSFPSGLLAVVTVILGIAAVKVGYPVLMPIAVATFVIAAAWPIREWFDARLPSALSYVCTIAALILLIGAFFVIIGYAFTRVVLTFSSQQDQIREIYESYGSLARDLGLPTPLSAAREGGSNFDRILLVAQALIAQIYAAVSYFGIVAVIVVLGFPEVPAIARKFRHQFGLDRSGQSSRTIETIREIARGFRSYIAMTALSSLITGVASSLWALTVGLDLVIVWGLLNFLLNFIPLIGNIVGIVPPTLYAAVQFGGWTMPLVVFAGFVVLQFVISNFIYPLLQSRGLAMPPVTIMISLLFWGWAWGLVGALFAVPLTAAAIVVMRKFDRTRSIAVVLGSNDPADEKD